MITDFKLIGLSKPKHMTCETLDNENIFWAKTKLSQDRFDALWNYFSTNKPMKMIAEIEHDGLMNDGTPINPIVISVRDL